MTRRVVRMTGAGGLIAMAALAAVLARTAISQGQQASPTDTSTAFVAPVDVDTAGLPGPRQPIFFRHDIHAGQYQLDCRYCHSYVEQSANPGMPSVASCMGCHRFVAQDNPEVQKLVQAANNGTTVEWVEVHPLAQFVKFPHMRHVVNGGLACRECHGQVERMPQVYRASSLKMGWCVGCHVNREYRDHPGRPVTTDCTACHY